jgi:hypothetical protein
MFTKSHQLDETPLDPTQQSRAKPHSSPKQPQDRGSHSGQSRFIHNPAITFPEMNAVPE